MKKIQFINGTLTKKANELLANWEGLPIGYEKSLTITLCREYK